MRLLIALLLIQVSPAALAQGQPLPVPDRAPANNGAAPTNTRYVDTTIQGRAPLTSPVFSGKVTTPTVALTAPGSTGDASGFCVKVPGSALCRTLADRAADVVSAADRPGVDRTGATDSAAGLASAFSAAAAVGTGAEIPGGLYRLGAFVAPPVNTPVAYRGLQIVGSGCLDIPDCSPLLTAPTTGWARRSNRAGTEFGVISSFDVLPTTGGDYQKAAGYFSARQFDPSAYAGVDGATADRWRDLVGLHATATIAPGNKRGRVWGVSAYAVIPPGGEGTGIAFEANIMNRSGQDQPLLDQITTTTGINSVSFGGRATTAYLADGGVDKENGVMGDWYNGFVAKEGVIRNVVFGVLKANGLGTWNFRVNPDGAVTAASLTSNGGVSATGGLYGASLTLAGANALVGNGARAGVAASLRSAAGDLSVTASGSNTTYLGSPMSPVTAQGSFLAGGDLKTNGKVGFNGANPVGKCVLPVALPTDGSAGTAALASASNAVRACLVTVGLAK